MQTAVFSDVHGNLVALGAMLADLARRPVDRLRAALKRVAETLRIAELGCPVVLGNLIRGYAPTIDVDVGAGHTLLACHGSPAAFDEILLPSTPEEQLRAAVADVDADVVAGGHVHMQWTRPIAHRTWLNPGSVGLAYDHEQDGDDVRFRPTAEYAVVSDGLEIEFRRVPFDAQAVVDAVEASGRPHAERYVRGWRS